MHYIVNRVISDAAIERLHNIFSTMDRGFQCFMTTERE